MSVGVPTTPLAAKLYADLPTLSEPDPQFDYAGATLVKAIAAPMELAYSVALDPTILIDPDRIDDALVPWLSQQVGVNTVGQTVARLREQIKNPPSWERGSTEAIAEAVRGVLTGTRYVSIRDRYNPSTAPADAPWHLTIVTLPAESPDAGSIIAAARLMAPAWTVLHSLVGSGTSWDSTSGTWDAQTDTWDEG